MSNSVFASGLLRADIRYTIRTLPFIPFLIVLDTPSHRLVFHTPIRHTQCRAIRYTLTSTSVSSLPRLSGHLCITRETNHASHPGPRGSLVASLSKRRLLLLPYPYPRHHVGGSEESPGCGVQPHRSMSAVWKKRIGSLLAGGFLYLVQGMAYTA